MFDCLLGGRDCRVPLVAYSMVLIRKQVRLSSLLFFSLLVRNN